MILGFDQDDQNLIDNVTNQMMDIPEVEANMFMSEEEEDINFEYQQTQQQIEQQQNEEEITEGNPFNINLRPYEGQEKYFDPFMMRSSEFEQQQQIIQPQQIMQSQQQPQQIQGGGGYLNQRLSPGPTSNQKIKEDNILEKLEQYEPAKKRKKKEDYDYMMMDRSSESPPNYEMLQKQLAKNNNTKKIQKRKTPKRQGTTKKKSHKRTQAEIQKDKARLAYLVDLKNPTEQEKEERKRLRNRETAKQSRDKKKREVRELQHQLCNMENYNEDLKRKLAEAKVEIRELKKIIEECPTCHAKTEAKFDKKSIFLFCIIFCICLTGIVSLSRPTLTATTGTTSKELIATTGYQQGTQRNLLSTNDVIIQNVPHPIPQETTRTLSKTNQKKNIQEGSGLLVDNQYDTRYIPHNLITDGLEKDRILVPGVVKGHFASQTNTDVNNTSPLEPSIAKSKAILASQNPKKNLSTDMEEAVLYHHPIINKDDEDEDMIEDSRPLLFCPFVYPLLPAPENRKNQIGAQSLRILYPVEVIENNDTKLYRLAQLETVPVTSETNQADIYLKFEEYEKLTKQTTNFMKNSEVTEPFLSKSN